MPVSAYVHERVLLFGRGGPVRFGRHFRDCSFWVYLAIFAAIFIASFLMLDPDLARERMRPGGKKPPLGAAAIFRRPVAALDHRRARPRPLSLERYGAAVAPNPGPWSRSPAATRFASGRCGEPVLFLGRPHPIRPRPIRGDHRPLRGHSPPGLSCGHRHRAGQRRGARLLARGRVSCDHDAAVSAVPRNHGGPNSSCRASGLSGLRRHACAGGLFRAFGERAQGFSSNFKCRPVNPMIRIRHIMEYIRLPRIYGLSDTANVIPSKAGTTWGGSLPRSTS